MKLRKKLSNTFNKRSLLRRDQCTDEERKKRIILQGDKEIKQYLSTRSCCQKRSVTCWWSPTTSPDQRRSKTPQYSAKNPPCHHPNRELLPPCLGTFGCGAHIVSHQRKILDSQWKINGQEYYREMLQLPKTSIPSVPTKDILRYGILHQCP